MGFFGFFGFGAMIAVFFFGIFMLGVQLIRESHTGYSRADRSTSFFGGIAAIAIGIAGVVFGIGLALIEFRTAP